jgi:preprotein translocase subunit SecE
MASASDDRDDNAPSDRLRAKNPFDFFGQVRAEARKVTWATRQEVQVSTIMVMIMVVIAALFLFLVDTLIRMFVGFVLNF